MATRSSWTSSCPRTTGWGAGCPRRFGVPPALRCTPGAPPCDCSARRGAYTSARRPASARLQASVAHQRHPGAKWPAAGQLEVGHRGRVLEQPEATAQDDRVDEQAVLVDEPLGDQLAHKRHAAGELELGPLLELADLVDSAQDRGVVPLGILEGGRDDVLAHPVQMVFHPGGVVGLLGPEAVHLLEGPAASSSAFSSAMCSWRTASMSEVSTSSSPA